MKDFGIRIVDQLNKYLDFQRDVFIHRKGEKNAKV